MSKSMLMPNSQIQPIKGYPPSSGKKQTHRHSKFIQKLYPLNWALLNSQNYYIPFSNKIHK